MTTIHRLLPTLVLLLLAPTFAAATYEFLGQDATAAKTREAAPTNTRKASYKKPPAQVDRIVVKKSERRLYLMRGDKIYRSYKIALGYQPEGHKQRQGDGKTPEGRYVIDRKHPGSSFRKALHISYPNIQDRLRASRRGKSPGGAIMIHGQPNGRKTRKDDDWTFGCIAVSNMGIDEIYGNVDVGTPIEILP